MRISILLLNQGRGSGEVARQQARHLQLQGDEVSLIYPGISAGPNLEKIEAVEVELESDCVPVHEYLPAADTGQKAVSTMSLEEARAYLPAYERALESQASESDIFIGHHANLSAIATARVAQRHGKPYLLFLHGTGIEPRHHGGYDDQLWAQIEAAIRGAAGIIVTTDYVRDELICPIIDLPKQRFLVLPCGVDLDDFHPSNRGDVVQRFKLREPFVICPGALTHSKGPQNVVAASHLYSDLAQTIFIGAGNLRSELEEALDDRGCFLGFVSSEDKAWLINSATLLVAAPEKREHFGIIYAEALAGGTPCVAYEGGGVGSIINPEVGLLTERSPTALGQGIRTLLEDPERRARMVQAARPRAEALYDYPELIARLRAWMQSFLE